MRAGEQAPKGTGSTADTGSPDSTGSTASTADTGVPDSTGSTGDTGVNTCATIPDETGGPFPGDGTNRFEGEVHNALLLSGIVRSDIRPGLAGATGTAEGVTLTLRLRLVDTSGGCAPLSGYVVYLWHCDREGRYSMYELPDQNWLRGIQEADDDGVVTFVTVFPGCYRFQKDAQ